MPALVTKGGALQGVIGVVGGTAQPQGQVQVGGWVLGFGGVGVGDWGWGWGWGWISRVELFVAVCCLVVETNSAPACHAQAPNHLPPTQPTTHP